MNEPGSPSKGYIGGRGLAREGLAAGVGAGVSDAVLPRFAVVGHPNKGKSSIVATLAADDSVTIAPDPGTTTRCRRFPMRVDDRTLYVLIDTPGFQRARSALAWMQGEAERRGLAADRRHEAVAAFVEAHRGTDRFPDERELLTPLLAGAAVLYVVDGSRPYGPEYEAEMEILRWTGRPSMALINPIGAADYVGSWRSALSQFFRTVRVFDALAAPFARRLELLRAFAALDEQWKPKLDEAIEHLERDRRARDAQAASELADLLIDLLTHSETKSLPPEADACVHEPMLRDACLDWLRQREARARRAVELAYEHHRLERRETPLRAEGPDLFSESQWRVWGLSQRQLAAGGALGGAAAGGAVDAGLLGSTFFLGSAIGATLGGAAGWLGTRKLAAVRVMRLSMGRRRLRVGPVRHANFPWVAIGRATSHWRQVAGRAHADRRSLSLDDPQTHWSRQLSVSTRRKLNRLFARVRRGESRETTHPELRDAIGRAMAELADEFDT